MILILLSWCYIFFTAVSFGIAFSKLMRIGLYDSISTTISGLFSITIMAAIWAFFGPIAIGFHCVLVVLSVFFWYKSKDIFNSICRDTWSTIKVYSFPVKVLLAVSSMLILAQSATLPFIIDNESYYIQTIKWLNEYGFVKGLANLHLFFGQNSGWHITQSVYSLSFLYDRFNDLNGFLMLLANLFAFRALDTYFSKGNRLDLVFGLLPIAYIFLFQFISSPSPDLPVYVFAFLIFSIYLQNNVVREGFIFISILALFAFFIKVTAVILLIFPIILLLRNFKALKNTVFPLAAIGFGVLALFVLKNTMLTGYPLFPLLNFRINELDYTVPSIIMDFFFSKSMLNSFYIHNSAFATASIGTLIKHYFLLNGLAGYMGIASVLMLVITPITIIRSRLSAHIWGIYFAFIGLAVLLCFGSVQYRFYIYFTIFFFLLLVANIFSSRTWVIRLHTLSLFSVVFILVFPTSYSSLTSNELLGENNTVHLRNILIPEPNSKWKPEYVGASTGNMIYNTPADGSFFWVSGNGKLPCVNEVQVEYFEHGFLYIPQQRSIDLNDGFYAQKISGHD